MSKLVLCAKRSDKNSIIYDELLPVSVKIIVTMSFSSRLQTEQSLAKIEQHSFYMQSHFISIYERYACIQADHVKEKLLRY